MSIPKIIHYCWFGKEIPNKFKDYINGWERTCPDYEIMLWNETNYDINSNEFLKKAVQSNKWAFVADYVRLDVLYKYGGIYLDTDVELLKNFDVFLNKKLVFGFETSKEVNAAVVLAEKNHVFLKEMLDIYNTGLFEGRLIVDNLIPIPYTLTQTLIKKGLVPNGTCQLLGEGIHILTRDFFYPLSYEAEGKLFTNNTVCIHHYAGTWSNGITKVDVFFKKHFSFSIRPLILFLSKIKRKFRGK